MINEVSVSNFRCFREQQTVRLAPLTLLVGENSTGKTSFMALVRALWGLAYQSIVPDFKAPPYDLGSFDEIAHHRGASGGRASEFYAGFQAPTIRRSLRATPSARKPRRFEFGVTFSKRGTAPFPITLKLSNGATWVEVVFRIRILYSDSGLVAEHGKPRMRAAFQEPQLTVAVLSCRLIHHIYCIAS